MVLKIEHLQKYWNKEDIVLYCAECKAETLSHVVNENLAVNNKGKLKPGKPYIFCYECRTKDESTWNPLVLARKIIDGDEVRYQPITNKWELKALPINEKPERIPLPPFEKPTSLEDAAEKIREIDRLGARNQKEHSYKYGLCYIAAKKEVGHRNFGDWIKQNTRWSHKTACNYMNHAERCV